MRKKFILFVFLLIVSIGALSFQEEVSAVNTSEIYYEAVEMSYEIHPSGTVDAKRSYTFVNESDLKKIESVTQSLPTETLENLKVRDNNNQPIQHEILSSTSEETTLRIYFDEELEPGNTFDYEISYSDTDFLTEKGPRYKGSFGGVSLGPNSIPYRNFIVKVHGPPSSRLFTYFPSSITEVENGIQYEGQLSPTEKFSGVRGVWYSSPVYYKISLTETLKNKTEEKINNAKFDLYLFNKGSTRQKSALLNFPPELETVYSGEENNWRGLLKTDEISPGSSKKFRIEIIQRVEFYDPSLTESETGDIAEVPSSLNTYLKPREYWQVDNPTLQEAAEEIVGGETNSYRVAKKIIDFVTEKLTYKVQSDRIGALNAYQYEVGDCSEYTDLSITLARTMGLPARASYGWSYRDGELIGHAWPEFYFSGVGWEPADPTWTDTGGQLGSGGLRPGPKPRGGGFGKFSPALIGTTESYLSRMDSIHILRNIKGLKSSESFGRYVYEGGEPTVSEEKDVEILSKAEAAEKLVQAAKINANIASQTLSGEGESNLSSDISLAEQFASSAENSESVEEKIEMSWKSIRHSDKVIRQKSEKPSLSGEEDESEDFPLRLVLLIILGAWIALGVWYSLKKR